MAHGGHAVVQGRCNPVLFSRVVHESVDDSP